MQTLQDGFGWTNGVALWLLDRYAQSFARALVREGDVHTTPR